VKPVPRRRFSQVDVFAASGLLGNPVAVVHDASGLSTEEMLALTAWTNLSETTFLLPPEDSAADYRVRIFCPGRELPFAGHPTLGTCAAWLAAGGRPLADAVVVQECAAGLVTIRRAGGRLAFAAPPLVRSGPVAPGDLGDRLDRLGLAAADVVEAAWIDNGPGWIGILLASAEAVLAVDRPSGTEASFDVGLLGLHQPGGEYAVEVRAFFADATGAIREDPVTGSLNASAAQWLIDSGRLTAPFVARQGTAVGRAGRVHIDVADGELWVGGDTAVVIDGSIDL
jgi:PhzF family phenazine biosynthesis protein